VLGAITQGARIDAGGAEFHRVPDEPGFDPGHRADLGVKLRSKKRARL